MNNQAELKKLSTHTDLSKNINFTSGNLLYLLSIFHHVCPIAQ